MMSLARFIRSIRLPVILLSMWLLHPIQGAEIPKSVCDRDPSTALVFVGILTDAKPMEGHSEFTIAKFRVNELLQGDAPSEVSVLIYNGLCGNGEKAPETGGTYLVRSHLLSGGNLEQLEQCDQLRSVSQATEEVEYFRSAQRGETPTEVSGEARLEPYGYPNKRIPLPKTRIHIVGGGKQRDFISDENGLFRSAFSPGRYTVTFEFPAGYGPDIYNRCGPPKFAVAEHLCTAVALCASPTGSFTAHIVDVDGVPLGPMSNVQLTLETADGQEFVQSVWPDENSNLVAENLMPGKYILGLNTYLGIDRGSAPYPPIYYPGVSRRSQTEVITLEPGEHKKLPEMRIKRGAGCEIPVCVVDGQGMPSPSTQVAVAYSDYPNFYVIPGEQTDAYGRETIYAVFPGPVSLRAEKPNQDASALESDIVVVSSCPAQPVLLKLSHRVTFPPNSQGN